MITVLSKLHSAKVGWFFNLIAAVERHPYFIWLHCVIKVDLIQETSTHCASKPSGKKKKKKIYLPRYLALLVYQMMTFVKR